MTAPRLAAARSGQAVAGFPFADVALARRLEHAEAVSNARFVEARGCDLALMGAAPGSGSQRNAERNGFRIAYTRLKWKR
jgi:hypothetical protein